MGNPTKKKRKKKGLFGEVQILTTSHFVVWVSRVTNIATAFGPPNFQMEIKWLLLIHSLKKNPPIKIPRSTPGTTGRFLYLLQQIRRLTLDQHENLTALWEAYQTACNCVYTIGWHY